MGLCLSPSRSPNSSIGAFRYDEWKEASQDGSLEMELLRNTQDLPSVSEPIPVVEQEPQVYECFCSLLARYRDANELAVMQYLQDFLLVQLKYYDEHPQFQYYADGYANLIAHFLKNCKRWTELTFTREDITIRIVNNKIQDKGNLCVICADQKTSLKLPCGHDLCKLCTVRCQRCPFCRTHYNPAVVCGEGTAVISVDVQQHIDFSYFLMDEDTGEKWLKEFTFYCDNLDPNEEETSFSWLVRTPFNFALASGPEGSEKILRYYNVDQYPTFHQVKKCVVEYIAHQVANKE